MRLATVLMNSWSCEVTNYAKKQWERDGIKLEMTEEDLELLKEHTVDFIFFSSLIIQVVWLQVIQKLMKRLLEISLLLSKIHIWKLQSGVGKLTH